MKCHGFILRLSAAGWYTWRGQARPATAEDEVAKDRASSRLDDKTTTQFDA